MYTTTLFQYNVLNRVYIINSVFNMAKTIFSNIRKATNIGNN